MEVEEEGLIQKQLAVNLVLQVQRWCAVLGVVVLFVSSASSQPNNIVKEYSLRDGLSLNIVTSIAQDKKGLMWLATEDGLNRFDGYSFKTFKYDPDNSFSLTGNFIQKVFVDSKGDIWVSTRHGLNRFDASSEKFTHFQHIIGDDRTLVGNDISDITESSSGNLWVASYNAGFSYYDRHRNAFTSYNQQNLPSLSSNKIISLFQDHAGLLWVGTQDAGVNVFKVKDGIVSEKIKGLPHNQFSSSSNIKCIYEDHLHNIWLGTSRGLVLLKRDQSIATKFDAQVFSLGSNIVLSILEDSKEMMWIGVQDRGAYQLDISQFYNQGAETASFKKVKERGETLLTQRSVQALFEDRDQNIWLGTYGGGVKMVSNQQEKFSKLRLSPSPPDDDIRYYGVCTDGKGNLWLGTDGNGIYKCDANGTVLEHFTAGDGSGLTDSAILYAYQDTDQNLWFGSYSQGLFLYKQETGSFINYKHKQSDSNTLGGNDVRVIFEDSRKNLWVGTNGGGLSKLDKKTKSFQSFNASNSNIASNDIRALAEDHNGKLWVGTYGGGLYSFSPDKQAFVRHHYKDQEYLSSDVVLALYLDKGKNLWIGTEEDGLILYDTAKKSAIRYSEKNGLANNTVYAIHPDILGNVWMSTNKGVTKLEVNTQRFYNYGASDGLQGGQFNPGSILYSKIGGFMGFGGTEGFNIFYPSQIKGVAVTPKVMMLGLQLFNKPVLLEAFKNDVSNKPVLEEETKEITLKPNQSVFTLEFGALDYTNPEKYQYAYKLGGLDEDWSYVGNQRSATYRYLKPGSYTFMVKASNHNGNWGEDYTALQINVLAPFWRTPLAYSLYLLVLAGVVYWGYHFSAKQKKLRRRLLIAKAQSRKERRVARERLNFFTEVSHEFRTPLTLILGPLEEMLSHEDRTTGSGRKLQMVYQNANKLLNLINKLLDYRKAEAGSMVLQVKEDNIAAFLEEICIPFKELAQIKKLDFHLMVPEEPLMVWYDREKLEIVINNLLSNSFKYIGKGNSISVAVRVDERFSASSEQYAGCVIVEVKDNGIGVPAGQLKHIFNWFYQGNPMAPMSSGLGLALAKKLIQLHKGHIFVNSTEGEGATFGFKLPLGKEHFDAGSLVDNPVPAVGAESKLEILAMKEVPEDTAAISHKGHKKVLIVEDEDEIRNFLKSYLRDNYSLIEAANGKDGLEQALVHYPDIIISDVMMPEMDGIALCKELKSNIRTSHIPVILLTARTAFAHHKEGLEIGADAYLTKPFSPELLQLKIQNILQSQEKLKRFHLNLFSVNPPQPKEEPNSLDEKLLLKIYEVLKANLDNSDFNVNELVAELNMSRSLVYKKIKALTGVSPVEYLRSLKMQEAARLLRSGNYKVFEVVYMVGFNDEKYFRQCFSKQFGCSPSEYMKSGEFAL
ncbi:hybrid sensor histidine kinase/response regulator transcription factor [Pontibacter harenae]|uniref:hybrid sensor histidine kinase/response regulator transcription factor n=1 Tax=Pontibacter harenae TaxID=2894083 RepID=UPI001E64C38C|nr:two-component regulator propeller domain-containing protein [Pontibacter harenae]MCC9168694.1 response regulator [Pontibacter harenae]